MRLTNYTQAYAPIDNFAKNHNCWLKFDVSTSHCFHNRNEAIVSQETINIILMWAWHAANRCYRAFLMRVMSVYG